MISDIERNYQPKKWKKVGGYDVGALPLNRVELSYFCNSDSQRFKDLLRMERAEKAFLIDYELLHLDLDPRCGTFFCRPFKGNLIMGVFTADGPLYFEEEV